MKEKIQESSNGKDINTMLLAAQCFSFDRATQTVESVANLIKVSRSFFLSRVSLARTAMRKMR